jgi:hypothetical protein
MKFVNYSISFFISAINFAGATMQFSVTTMRRDVFAMKFDGTTMIFSVTTMPRNVPAIFSDA